MLRTEFRSLALKFADDVMFLVKKEIMDQLKTRKSKSKASKAPVKRRPCRVPGCEEPSKGPRYDFFCDEHRKMSKAAKAAVKNGEPLPSKKPVAKKAAKKAAPKKVAKPVAKPKKKVAKKPTPAKKPQAQAKKKAVPAKVNGATVAAAAAEFPISVEN